MTVKDLERLIEDWRAAGAEDETPVLLATQPHWTLIHETRPDFAVVHGDPELGEDVSHVLLCEGSQRYDDAGPYATEEEVEVLREAGWGGM